MRCPVISVQLTSSSSRAGPSGCTSTPEPTWSRASRGASSRPAPTRPPPPRRSDGCSPRVDGDHFPNREATLGQALDKYLEVANLEVSTREAHEGYIRRIIGPVLSEVKIRKLGVDSLDSLYTGPEEVLAATPAAPAH